MTNTEIINYLNSKNFGFSNTAKVSYFESTRHKKNGENQQIIIEIHNHGDDSPLETRFVVHARDKNDARIYTSGNSSDNLQAALAIVRWQELDYDPR